MLRQKELVEQENVEIRKRLSSVMSLIQPFLGVPPSHREFDFHSGDVGRRQW